MIDWSNPVTQLTAVVAVLGVLLILTLWLAVILPHIPVSRVKQAIVGYKAPPILVAAVRRLITAIGTAAVTGLVAWLGTIETGPLVSVAGATAGVIEAGWGMFDQAFKADQNDRNPPAVAGGGSEEVLG